MKYSNLIKGTLSLFFFLLVVNASVLSQEWSSEQKEVWRNIEEYNSILWENKDIEGFLKYVHDDYRGWDYEDPVPTNKETLKKLLIDRVPKREILVYYLYPLEIKIYDNCAFVHYYSTRIIKDLEGKEKRVKTTWTEILLNQGEKWVIIGDRSGEMPEE